MTTPVCLWLNCPLGSREYDLHFTTSYSNPKGSADTERFMRTFKEEIIYSNEFDSLEETTMVVDNFITFYNQDYLHSALGYLSPIDFEKLNKYKYVA